MNEHLVEALLIGGPVDGKRLVVRDTDEEIKYVVYEHKDFTLIKESEEISVPRIVYYRRTTFMARDLLEPITTIFIYEPMLPCGVGQLVKWLMRGYRENDTEI